MIVLSGRSSCKSSAQDPLGIYERRTHRTMNLTELIQISLVLIPGKDPFPPETVAMEVIWRKNSWISRVTWCQNNRMSGSTWGIRSPVHYAEACLELGETVEARSTWTWSVTEAAFRILRVISKKLYATRRIELYGEESRFYDVRRWKIMIQVMTPPLGGIDILEVKKYEWIYCYNLEMDKSTYRQCDDCQTILVPIPRTEIKKAPHLYRIHCTTDQIIR